MEVWQALDRALNLFKALTFSSTIWYLEENCIERLKWSAIWRSQSQITTSMPKYEGPWSVPILTQFFQKMSFAKFLAILLGKWRNIFRFIKDSDSKHILRTLALSKLSDSIEAKSKATTLFFVWAMSMINANDLCRNETVLQVARSVSVLKIINLDFHSPNGESGGDMRVQSQLRHAPHIVPLEREALRRSDEMSNSTCSCRWRLA